MNRWHNTIAKKEKKMTKQTKWYQQGGNHKHLLVGAGFGALLLAGATTAFAHPYFYSKLDAEMIAPSVAIYDSGEFVTTSDKLRWGVGFEFGHRWENGASIYGTYNYWNQSNDSILNTHENYGNNILVVGGDYAFFFGRNINVTMGGGLGVNIISEVTSVKDSNVAYQQVRASTAAVAVFVPKIEFNYNFFVPGTDVTPGDQHVKSAFGVDMVFSLYTKYYVALNDAKFFAGTSNEYSVSNLGQGWTAGGSLGFRF